MPFSSMAISDRRSLPREDSLPEWLDRLAGARVPAVQIREKDLPDRAVFELVVEARRQLPSSTRLLVNGRADIALASGADGVHLPVSSLPAAALRRRFGSRLLLGCSTHSLGEVRAALRSGADYATFGPVFHTPSKAELGSPVGLSALREASQLGLPLLALGGVTQEAFSDLAAAGARGVAGIRLFQQVSSGLAAAAEAARAAFAPS